MSSSAAAAIVDNRLDCPVAGCTHKSHYLVEHMAEHHPEVPVLDASTLTSDELETLHSAARSGVRRVLPDLTALTADIMGFQAPVNTMIREDQCLEDVPHYAFPTKGAARKAFRRAVVALLRGRPVFIWGGPGTGKDAVVHHICATLRVPSIIMTFTSGTDVKKWFYARKIDSEGTGYEFGALWHALTEGVKGRDGKFYPALILFSDVDRGSEEQLEEFRLILDTTSKRIKGPYGNTHRVVPGTRFAFTANSCGNGADNMSSQVMDASLIDRMGRFVEFTHLHWDDESAILRAKYPTLVEVAPLVFDELGKAVDALRLLIKDGRLFAELTHRGLCEVLTECEDNIWAHNESPTSTDVPKNLLSNSFSAWLERLDEDNRLIARRAIDPHITGGCFPSDDEEETPL